MIVNATLALELRAFGAQGVASLILSLGGLWPVVAVTVKRLHDRGRSAWFLLAFLIPVLGPIWLLVEVWALSGTGGANRFGDAPLDKGLDRRWVVPFEIAGGAVLISLLGWIFFWPGAALTPALTVDLVEARHGPLNVTLDAEGETRLQTGDPGGLAIVVDYLSIDAANIETGQRVIIGNRGGAQPLEGRVRGIESPGFFEISALGREEQRVNVLIDFVGDRGWERLGDGYKVETRIVVWEAGDALSVPLATLFREGDEWAVFVEEEGRAELRIVTLGHKTGIRAEIRTGIKAGERVIAYPNDRVADGVRIQSRD